MRGEGWMAAFGNRKRHLEAFVARTRLRVIVENVTGCATKFVYELSGNFGIQKAKKLF